MINKLFSIFSKPEQITVLAFGKSRTNGSSFPSIDSYGYFNQLYINSVKYAGVEFRKNMTEDEIKTALTCVFAGFGFDTNEAVLAVVDRIDQYDLAKLGKERLAFNVKTKSLKVDKSTKYKVEAGHLANEEFFEVVSRCKMVYDECEIEDVAMRRSIFMNEVCNLVTDFVGKKCEYIGISNCDEETAMKGAMLMETFLDKDFDVDKDLAFVKQHFFKVHNS